VRDASRLEGFDMSDLQRTPEQVISFKTANKRIVLPGQRTPENLKCIRFRGIYLNENVVVFTKSKINELRSYVTVPAVSVHYENALDLFERTPGIIENIRRDNVSNIDEMSPPFEDTASATDVAVHIISELDVRVDQVGTHFFVDFTLMNSESFSLMFSAPVLYLLLDYLET
jgi:hypothetical protein